MIISLAILIVPSAAHANLLTNSSFESGSDPSADFWTLMGYDSGSGTWGINNGTEKKTGWGAYSGDASVIIVGQGIWGWSGTGFAFQPVAVTANTPYAYSIWTNTDGSGSGTGTYYMKVEWYNGGNLVSGDTHNINLLDGWAQQAFNLMSPATADSAHIIFGQTDGTCANVTKWDDADFHSSGIPAAPEPVSTILFLTGGMVLTASRICRNKK